MVAGNPVSVQSPARNRFLNDVTGPGRSAFCSGVASNVARRSRTICQGGNGKSPCRPAALQTSRQIASASSSRGMSTRRSPLLMVTDSRCGNANSHSTRPPTTPRIGGGIAGRIEAEMRVDDGAEFRRRLQARQQRRRRARRHREHHDVVGAERNRVAAEFQFADIAARHRELAQLMAELDRGALVLQQLDRGLDQNRAQAVARDQRPAGLPARQQRFPHDRAGQARRALGRIDIERRQQQRLHQPLVQRALAGDRVADQLVRCLPRSAAPMRDNRAAWYRGRGAPRRTPIAAIGRRRDRAASAGRS